MKISQALFAFAIVCCMMAVSANPKKGNHSHVAKDTIATALFYSRQARGPLRMPAGPMGEERPILIQNSQGSWYIIFMVKGEITRYYMSDTLPDLGYKWIMFDQGIGVAKRTENKKWYYTDLEIYDLHERKRV